MCSPWQSLHEGVFGQVGDTVEYMTLNKQVTPGQATDIAQGRVQTIGAAGEQEQVQVAVQQACDVAKAA